MLSSFCRAGAPPRGGGSLRLCVLLSLTAGDSHPATWLYFRTSSLPRKQTNPLHTTVFFFSALWRALKRPHLSVAGGMLWARLCAGRRLPPGRHRGGGQAPSHPQRTAGPPGEPHPPPPGADNDRFNHDAPAHPQHSAKLQAAHCPFANTHVQKAADFVPFAHAGHTLEHSIWNAPFCSQTRDMGDCGSSLLRLSCRKHETEISRPVAAPGGCRSYGSSPSYLLNHCRTIPRTS